jgi:TRAP-type C4-dicarboxylate transport system substrate-binding protein
MVRRPLTIAAWLVTVVFVLAACGTTAPADDATSEPTPAPEESPDTTPDSEPTGDVIVIRHTQFNPPQSLYGELHTWWAEEIEARTNGQVEVEIFFGDALLPSTEVLTGVGDGRADSGFLVDNAFPGNVPLTTISSLPFTGDETEAQVKAFTDLYADYEPFRAEWEAMNVRVLQFDPSFPSVIGTAEPVESLDDLEGLSIRCLGYVCSALEAVGANPVAMAAPEIYEAIQRGLLDGYASVPFSAISALAFDEVAPYVLDSGLGLYIQGATVINADLWDSLPADVQQVIEEVSSEYLGEFLRRAGPFEAETCDALIESNVTINTLSEAEVDRWAEAYGEAALDDWRSLAEGQGAPADEFYERYLEALDRHQGASEYGYETGTQGCAARMAGG